MELKDIKVDDIVKTKLDLMFAAKKPAGSACKVLKVGSEGYRTDLVCVELEGFRKWVSYKDLCKPQSEISTRDGLTGSALAHAMLSRGDKLVLCLVSGISETAALNSRKYAVITEVKYNKFISTSKGVWVYAVPVDNQGKPLTGEEFIMSKFKVGDKVRRNKEFLSNNSNLYLAEYIVSSVKGPWIALEGESHTQGHPYWANYFELVEDVRAESEDYLTPQEVIQCLQDEVDLEFLNGDKWQTSNLLVCQVSSLLTNKYRKKPAVQMVNINGAEFPKPLDKSLISPSSTVFCISLLESVRTCSIAHAKNRDVPVWSTQEDAETALKAIQAAFT